MAKITTEDAVLMQRWASGDKTALDQLVEMVYDELQKMAHNHLRLERRNHTLQTTALLNEAYIRMKQRQQIFGTSRAEFFSIASAAMRRVLVDHARAKLAAKRRGGAFTVALDEASDTPCRKVLEPEDLLNLDQALVDLQEFNAELRHLVEMKYFGGLKLDEIAKILKISRSTVKRRWERARLWLAIRLAKPATSDT